MCNIHHHHHHVAPPARISLIIFRHTSLSSIAPGRSSGQHPVSAQSCWMQVRAGRPAFACPCEGVYRSTSLMIWFLLHQQCPACLDRLILIVFVIGDWWSYSCYFVGCCLQDSFNIARWVDNESGVWVEHKTKGLLPLLQYATTVLSTTMII